MNPVLLVRKQLATKYELRFMEKIFLRLEESRTLCRDALVIGRYSILPFYDELDRDLRAVGSRLINSVDEHRWIASFDYYDELKSYTPATWTEESFPYCDYQGPFVVKGRLSSRKRKWRTHMFANTKRDALDVADRLKEDGEILEQGVVFRRYVPLKTYATGDNGLPFTNEWRFFCYGSQVLSVGYYWTMSVCVAQAELKPAAVQLAQHLTGIVSRFAKFYTMDLAETDSGDWILIELNDGQMAVPSENDLDELYGGLREAVLSKS